MHTPPRVGGASTSSLDADLRKRLLDIIQTAPTMAAGSVHLIGLEALRTRLGSRWDQVSDRVGTLTEKLLLQFLDARDIWFRHAADRYVVAFAERRKAEVQMICAKVVEQLQILLLGDAEAPSTRRPYLSWGRE